MAVRAEISYPQPQDTIMSESRIKKDQEVQYCFMWACVSFRFQMVAK